MGVARVRRRMVRGGREGERECVCRLYIELAEDFGMGKGEREMGREHTKERPSDPRILNTRVLLLVYNHTVLIYVSCRPLGHVGDPGSLV
jgi:hypothetical protein